MAADPADRIGALLDEAVGDGGIPGAVAAVGQGPVTCGRWSAFDFPAPAAIGSSTSPNTSGFRSTFRDWVGETTTHAREVIEASLAHKLKDKAEAAYARGDLFATRRKLMQDWADYLATPPATVLELREAPQAVAAK